jgi:hypothetical protein
VAADLRLLFGSYPPDGCGLGIKMYYVDESRSDDESSSEGEERSTVGYIEENTVPDTVEGQIIAKVVVQAVFFRAAMSNPSLSRLCPFCIEKARRKWPYYEVYCKALGTGTLGYQRTWGACAMCTLGYARVVTDYLVAAGCSVRRDVMVGIIRGIETRVGFMVTLPDGKEVALELDTDESFAPPRELHPPACEAYRISLVNEVMKMLFFRLDGIKFVRMHVESMARGNWRPQLLAALDDTVSAAYVGEMPENGWQALQMEIEMWKDLRMKDWLRANKYRFAKIAIWNQ